MPEITFLHGLAQAGQTIHRPNDVAPDGFAYLDTDLRLTIFRDNANGVWLDGLGRDITPGIMSLAGEGAPLDGVTGTGAGKAATACLYIDTLNAKLYINANTKASPLWSVVGAQTT